MDMSTGLSESDLRSVFLQFAEALAFSLTDGSEVQTPIGAIKLSVHCRSEGQKLSEDDMRLQIRGDRSLLARLRHGAAIEVINAPTPLVPKIILVENADIHGSVDSGSVGHILHGTGSRLRFAWDDAEQGVFFISVSAPSRVTKMAVYSHISSNIVDGKIPDLESGEYRLEIRTRPSGKDIRVGQYGRTITVVH
jgi:hypothetical protein